MQLLILLVREFQAGLEFQRLSTIRFGRLFNSTAVVVLLCSCMHTMQTTIQQDATKQQSIAGRTPILHRVMDDNVPASNQNFTALKDTGIAEGYMLMRVSDCYTCHADIKVLTAPSYVEIAEKYKNDKNAPSRLVNKIIEGGKGQWGDKPMNPHPELLREDAQKMIAYILHLRAKKDTSGLPAKSQ